VSAFHPLRTLWFGVIVGFVREKKPLLDHPAFVILASLSAICVLSFWLLYAYSGGSVLPATQGATESETLKIWGIWSVLVAIPIATLAWSFAIGRGTNPKVRFPPIADIRTHDPIAAVRSPIVANYRSGLIVVDVSVKTDAWSRMTHFPHLPLWRTRPD
jgi:hypothetical protein